jgi:predicted small lipoprotein YifL
MNIFYRLNSVKIIIILTALMLSACGMQGELYLPDDRPAENTGTITQTVK